MNVTIAVGDLTVLLAGGATRKNNTQNQRGHNGLSRQLKRIFPTGVGCAEWDEIDDGIQNEIRDEWAELVQTELDNETPEPHP